MIALLELELLLEAVIEKFLAVVVFVA